MTKLIVGFLLGSIITGVSGYAWLRYEAGVIQERQTLMMGELFKMMGPLGPLLPTSPDCEVVK